jgi:hypothetical protein
MWLCSEAHFKKLMRRSVPNYFFYRTDRLLGRKVEIRKLRRGLIPFLQDTVNTAHAAYF